MRTVLRERKTELLEALFARRMVRMGLESDGRWAESKHTKEEWGREVGSKEVLGSIGPFNF